MRESYPVRENLSAWELQVKTVAQDFLVQVHFLIPKPPSSGLIRLRQIGWQLRVIHLTIILSAECKSMCRTALGTSNRGLHAIKLPFGRERSTWELLLKAVSQDLLVQVYFVIPNLEAPTWLRGVSWFLRSIVSKRQIGSKEQQLMPFTSESFFVCRGYKQVWRTEAPNTNWIWSREKKNEKKKTRPELPDP